MDRVEKGVNWFCCAVVFAFASACEGENDPPNASPDDEGLAAETTDLPDTDIYLADLAIHNGVVAIDNLRPIVSGPGYANQPQFINSGAFLFTMEGAGGKTDLWRYDVETGTRTRVTSTPDRSEFSPKPSPHGGVSWIQESPGGEMTQVFEDGSAVIGFGPVGYYAWLDASPFVTGDALGVFYRSEPPTLHFARVETEENHAVAEAIGRTLQASPDARALYFSTVGADGRHTLKRMTFLTGYVTEELTTLPAGTEDFHVIFDAAGNAENVISVDGMQIVYHPLRSKDAADWEVVAALADVGAPSRIAVSNDRRQVAIVVSAAK